MIELKSDLLFFGYGEITKELINLFSSDGYEVFCITNQPTENISENVKFINRKEGRSYKILCDYAFFSWRDEKMLNQEESKLYEWLLKSITIRSGSYVFSSASLYKDSPFAVNESAINLDSSVNSNPKYLLETAVSSLMKRKQVPNSNLRISNIYGNNIKYGLIGQLIESEKTKEIVKIYSDVQFVRDYLFLSDLYKALRQLIKGSIHINTLNIATGIGLGVDDVINHLETLSFKVNYERFSDTTQNYKKVSILDNSLCKSLIQWNPKSLNENLIRMRA
jgi:UDP-glucose 4-epimerase